MKIKHYSPYMALMINIAIMYVIYALCRIEFILVNYDPLMPALLQNSWYDIIVGSLRFDTAGLFYINAAYILIMLLPLKIREHKTYQTIAKCIFLITNSIGIIANLADSLYFPFTGRRTTFSVVSEFANENNLGSVFANSILQYWYVVLFGIAIIAIVYILYAEPAHYKNDGIKFAGIKYYLLHTIILVAATAIVIIGIRGGATKATRPITISNANQYVNNPKEAAVILNTPFSFIRTISQQAFPDVQYMPDEKAQTLYTPVHQGSKGNFINKNVVILIVESFGREYFGSLNKHLDNGSYKGYTPFMDSLVSQSLTFDYTFCNGRKSIDGMPSILSSIPMFVEPFFLTAASMNNVGGIAHELGLMGYHSAFFHGAQNGSMGFQAFARATGFKEYYGRSEYDADPNTNADKDFDGTWAIWDEPFLQYYAKKMSGFKQPFITSVFTASSHHPFVVPEQYKDSFDKGTCEIHQCIGYTDHALRSFFATAKQQPWYYNTIFVMTSDHTNQSSHPEYTTDLGYYCSPILFFDPSGEMPRGIRHTIAQQIDIMPSLLGWLNYPNDYIAFGKDLFHTPDSASWAVNYNSGIYQYVTPDLKLLQFDGQNIKAVYDIQNDWMLTRNLKDSMDISHSAETLKSIIQQYMYRMNNNQIRL